MYEWPSFCFQGFCQSFASVPARLACSDPGKVGSGNCLVVSGSKGSIPGDSTYIWLFKMVTERQCLFF